MLKRFYSLIEMGSIFGNLTQKQHRNPLSGQVSGEEGGSRWEFKKKGPLRPPFSREVELRTTLGLWYLEMHLKNYLFTWLCQVFVVVCQLSCPRRMDGIIQFPNQGLNPCPMHHRADSLPLWATRRSLRCVPLLSLCCWPKSWLSPLKPNKKIWKESVEVIQRWL